MTSGQAARAPRWRAAIPPLAVLLGACPLVARAQPAAPVEELRSVEEERGRVEFLLRRLADRNQEVLAVLESAETEMRSARTEAESAIGARRDAEARLKEARRRADALLEARQELAAALGPRLLLRYRLSGGSYLQALLSSSSLADFLWTRRMTDRLLQGDLRAAARLRELEDEVHRAAAAVKSERAAFVSAEELARRREAEASARRETQRALLEAARTEQALHRRAVDELERSRQRLLEAIAAMPPVPEGLGGFGARRGRLAPPVRGAVEVPFGRRVDPDFRTVTQHKGVDVRAPAGEPVLAPHVGIVGFAGWFRGFGNLVVLDHGEGYYTLYAHLDEMAAELGTRVDEGDRLGTVGETGSLKGAYLYFEIRSGQKPLDPLEWLAPGALGRSEASASIGATP